MSYIGRPLANAAARSRASALDVVSFSCAAIIPIAWWITIRSAPISSSSATPPPLGVYCWYSTASWAMSAVTRASARCSSLSIPGLSRHRSNVPIPPGPAVSGRENSAYTPAAWAAAANAGQRFASAAARSGRNTGVPEARACRHGPSPSSICSPVTVEACRPAPASMLADSAPDISTSAHPDNAISSTANRQSRAISSPTPAAVSFSVTAAMMRARRPSSRMSPSSPARRSSREIPLTVTRNPSPEGPARARDQPTAGSSWSLEPLRRATTGLAELVFSGLSSLLKPTAALVTSHGPLEVMRRAERLRGNRSSATPLGPFSWSTSSSIWRSRCRVVQIVGGDLAGVQEYLGELGHPLAHLRFDISAYQLDPLGVQVVLELHPGSDKHAGRPELHGEDLLDAGDLGMAGDGGECRGAHNRIGGFADQQFLG